MIDAGQMYIWEPLVGKSRSLCADIIFELLLFLSAFDCPSTIQRRVSYALSVSVVAPLMCVML